MTERRGREIDRQSGKGKGEGKGHLTEGRKRLARKGIKDERIIVKGKGKGTNNVKWSVKEEGKGGC